MTPPRGGAVSAADSRTTRGLPTRTLLAAGAPMSRQELWRSWWWLLAVSACGTAPTQENVETGGLGGEGAPNGVARQGTPPADVGPVFSMDAAPMDEQLRAAASLGLPADARPTPRGVDGAIWRSAVPADNEGTPARVTLGRKLYFDTRLSADGTISCATCHDSTRGLADHRPVSKGIRDQTGRRNAPTTMNAVFFETQFWDGRAATLEQQATMPITNPIEMGQESGEAAVRAIASDPAAACSAPAVVVPVGADAQCGNFAPQPCLCGGGDTLNTHRALLDRLGPADCP